MTMPMTRLLRLGLFALLAQLLALDGAWAQGFSPRPGGGMGRPATKSETPKGPAEAAEDKEEERPELPPLPPWPGQQTKQLQLFQLRGYFRFRYDMFHNANLGMLDGGGFKAPFYNPLSEARDANGDPLARLNCKARKTIAVAGGSLSDRELDDDDCPANTLGGANMRLRLQPTINIGEQVRVHTLVDVFDNIVLGTNPAAITQDGSTPALMQDSQSGGAGSIVAKRAWADVRTPLGQILFGRMPVHWGMGMVANDGMCLDCDYGQSADRVMFKADIAGYTLAMGYDFNANGPTSFSYPGTYTYGGQAIDLEQLDDVDQWFWIIGRIDPDDVVKDLVDRGQLVFNYGLYLTWRKQDFDVAGGATGDKATDAENFVERHGWTLSPDLWFKLLYKKLALEFEGVIIAGRIGNVSNDPDELSDDYTVFQYGWALRSSYKVLRDSLSFGLELGMASGDQAEPRNGDLDRRRWHPLGANADGNLIDPDGSLREMRFNYDYHVDLLMFREILGTVSNAMYLKPWIQYLIVDSFGARLDMIYGMSHQPVATPGNSRNLGIELDLDIFYRNVEEKFFAGLQYGVLFPLAGMDRPATGVANGNSGELFGNYDYDAEVAHTLQARMIVEF